MNSYGPWWDTTITVYNKFEDPQTHVVKWYRHVVHDAFWKYAGEKVSVGYKSGQVLLETNDVICRIRKDAKFLEKHLWINVPNDEMGNYFTLGQGDIIVKGEVSDTIDEYTSGLRSSDLLTKYKALQGCMEIRKWANNTGGGRGNEHYYASGS